ncbi:MAG: RAD55 family ATPase [Thermoplasmatota archaeon]
MGNKRLDDLLRGGIEDANFALLYGPRFLGKELLARRFLLSGLHQGIPGILVLTDETVTDARRALITMDPLFPTYEERGLVRYVETYSRSIGAAGEVTQAEYVEGPMNLNGLSLAINNAEGQLIHEHPTHRLILDSLSTLVTYTNPQTTFRFLQVLIGRTRLAGATGMLLLDSGMHSDPDVQMFKHLMNGVLEVRVENEKTFLRVDGLGITDNPGWIQYKFAGEEFELTGSFAAGRIR